MWLCVPSRSSHPSALGKRRATCPPQPTLFLRTATQAAAGAQRCRRAHTQHGSAPKRALSRSGAGREGPKHAGSFRRAGPPCMLHPTRLPRALCPPRPHLRAGCAGSHVRRPMRAPFVAIEQLGGPAGIDRWRAGALLHHWSQASANNAARRPKGRDVASVPLRRPRPSAERRTLRTQMAQREGAGRCTRRLALPRHDDASPAPRHPEDMGSEGSAANASAHTPWPQRRRGKHAEAHPRHAHAQSGRRACAAAPPVSSQQARVVSHTPQGRPGGMLLPRWAPKRMPGPPASPPPPHPQALGLRAQVLRK